MSLFSRQPDEPRIDRQRSLNSIPALNPGVERDVQPDGRVLVTVRIPRRSKGLLARFQPAVIERRVRLDELGAFVLAHVDGVRSVADIVAAFIAAYGTTRREAELCTADFLKSLAQRHILSIGVR